MGAHHAGDRIAVAEPETVEAPRRNEKLEATANSK